MPPTPNAQPAPREAIDRSIPEEEPDVGAARGPIAQAPSHTQEDRVKEIAAVLTHMFMINQACKWGYASTGFKFSSTFKGNGFNGFTERSANLRKELAQSWTDAPMLSSSSFPPPPPTG
eukprot:CAMPEP_0204453872 /NCGR_PEP_ID=MMETSP0470-20130426/102074_1 /ASSEMBLY_ACC=CAM_ASM_000385 /TAXON_ID=2969 /ORGANISM="Oxyrrhis marina" /LENGTH=118 /DNA_ID=CAMNT_0051453727 /DNA_START=318 /DNA_END=673 /DNA_ORIENTATION=-